MHTFVAEDKTCSSEPIMKTTKRQKQSVSIFQTITERLADNNDELRLEADLQLPDRDHGTGELDISGKHEN